MPCLLALIILSLLGIFSASHRQLAKEAFDCVFRRITLRPCTTGFDLKIKSAVISRILRSAPVLAKLINRHFEFLSWIFTLSLILSLVWTVKGVYNFWAWGDCNGPYAAGGFCAFDPTGQNSKTSSGDSSCKDVAIASVNLSLDGFDTSLFAKTSSQPGNPELIMFGCYSCEYTRKTYPAIKKLVMDEAVSFTFVHFPVKTETQYLLNYDVCLSEQSAKLYAAYVDLMFQTPLQDLASEAYVSSRLPEIGANLDQLKSCLINPQTQAKVQTQQSEILNTGIYGTPTVFINSVGVVGPKPERVYRRLLHNSWF